MKKITYLFLLLALAVFWSCKDDDGNASFSVGAETLVFPYTGGTQTLEIAGDVKWGISKLPEWISASVASGIGSNTVTLTAMANPDNSDRNGYVVVFTEDGQQRIVVDIKQYGTHTSPIRLSSAEEIVLGGRRSPYINGGYFVEGSFDITCDTEWDIEGPSWVTILYNDEQIVLTSKSRQEGSGTIQLLANSTHTGSDTRFDTIYIRTVSGESEVKVPVRQLGRYDIHCIKPIACADGFVTYLKVGSSVEKIVPMVWDNSYDQSDITYETFNYVLTQTGSILNADQGDGTYFTMYAQQLYADMILDTDVTLLMLGVDANSYYAPIENVYKFSFHTLNEFELRPKVEITDVEYVNGHWKWNVVPNDYTTMYLTYYYSKSYLQAYNVNPLLMAFNMVWWYNNGNVSAFYGDISKSFQSENIDDDVIIVAVPLGQGYKPSLTSMYDTRPSANAPAKANIVFKHLTR